MPFNADDQVKALTPPEIVLDGVTYTGRLLSHPEYYRWDARINTWPTLSDDGALALEVKEFFGAMGFAPDVVERIVALPKSVVEGAIVDFFACQRQVVPGTGPQAA